MENSAQDIQLPKLEKTVLDGSRDRIVVLGRPAAGKTVYLSLLYEKLWKTHSDLSMKTVQGIHHANFIRTAEEMRQGQWPAPTSAKDVAPSHIELTYKGRPRLMIALDYGGELFVDAFVKEVDSEHVKIFFDHIDHAAAILLLADPAHVVGLDIDARIDNDFGFVQAIGRIRNWPNGASVPVILILTKVDHTKNILAQNGGTVAFVKKYFPQLVRLVPGLKVCKISAVQTTPNEQGRPVPKKDFTPVNLEEPLRHCLDVLEQNDILEAKHQKRKEYTKIIELQTREQERDAKIRTWVTWSFIAIMMGVFAYYLFGILWPLWFEKWLSWIFSK